MCHCNVRAVAALLGNMGSGGHRSVGAALPGQEGNGMGLKLLCSGEEEVAATDDKRHCHCYGGR